MKPLFVLLLIWNMATFLMMGVDKRLAIADKRRISEKTLLTSSFMMGAAGIAAGAIVFHHKTRKNKFIILVPLSILVNLAICYGLIYIAMK